MLYQINVEMKPGLIDPIAQGIKSDIKDLGIKSVKDVHFTQIYFIESDIKKEDVDLISQRLLADPVTHRYEVRETNARGDEETSKKDKKLQKGNIITVLHKPGVMDPVEESALKAIKDLGFKAKALRTGRQVIINAKLTTREKDQIARKVLANEVIDDVFYGKTSINKITIGNPYQFELKHIPLRSMTIEAMLKLSNDNQLSLNEQEMVAIKGYFDYIQRDPTDIELETIAQTWSEHCKHKTLRGLIEYEETQATGEKKTEKIDNLLKQTIMKVTEELAKPWCISVFKDNAGIIDFDDKNAVCFKVETHNHPSAIEPYGGAGTGIGGVIRDTLGCGLGAKPIINTDVFCFGLPDMDHKHLPQGVLHPKRVMKGVVAGVRDYGNRMGIPTTNGAVYFDKRYTGNPLVYCGNVGIMPKDKCEKNLKEGDLILVVGGRTGRDGIHGVTFASIELNEKSETVSSIAVQIGNAIVEKKVADTVLQARDLGLYSSITDCGGGGLSSAIGEMGEHTGAEVDLEKVTLKYDGLSYTEIWISEAQERMVLAVPPENKNKILEVFKRENVEATFVGKFTNDKKLTLRYKGNEVGKLDMSFLHDGVPKYSRLAEWHLPHHAEPRLPDLPSGKGRVSYYGKILRQLLGMWNIASKEWIIRQYDHEVQGGSVIKSMVGVANDGHSDAYVCRPLLDSYHGLVISNGMNPKYSDIDPYHMAASAIDEALRNIVAVGGDPHRTALLDNFCWGNTNKPDRLGALVRANRACYDIAKVYKTPFISGKDSLNNEFRTKTGSISIPHTLLISAISVIDDVRKTVTMDLKDVGNLIYLVGTTKNELGASHYYELLGHVGNNVPMVDPEQGRKVMDSLHNIIQRGYVKSCHDLSEGGLAVAIAEMAFAGDIGVKIDLEKVFCNKEIDRDDIIMFSESNSRFLVEVSPQHQKDFESLMKDCPYGLIGQTQKVKKLQINGLDGKPVMNESLNGLKESWKAPLKY
jgi:phosphoribosylformylglycinamidine synthase